MRTMKRYLVPLGKPIMAWSVASALRCNRVGSNKSVYEGENGLLNKRE